MRVKYDSYSNRELKSLQDQVNRIMTSNIDYDKSYLTDELKSIKTASTIPIKRRLINKIKEKKQELSAKAFEQWLKHSGLKKLYSIVEIYGEDVKDEHLNGCYESVNI